MSERPRHGSAPAKPPDGREMARLAVLEPGSRPRPAQATRRVLGAERPSVSCLMITRGDLFPARLAIECFLAQTYAPRELVIVCATPGGAVLEALVDAVQDPRIRFVAAPPGTLGSLRNRAVAAARGELLCIWDDDDLCAPGRIEEQVAALLATGAAAAFLPMLHAWWPAQRRLAATDRRPWEGSMLVRRALAPRYPEIERGEDTAVLQALRTEHPIVLTAPGRQYCYVIHGGNISPEAHFEAIIGRARHRFGNEDYSRVLGLLSQEMPIRGYLAGLAARAGVHTADTAATG